ncbi:acylneuraminate cytidylyltransferase family protein [candidate division KSB1 bacterium]|nr:acylneuraminate cytidylyltransferase family protein [candidate division KSB1 bacterium]
MPKKNIRLLNGKPLIAYAIEAAKTSRSVDRIVISTDDEEIKQVALEYGAEVPFKRPAEISEDVPTEDVALHAVNWLKESESYLPDIVVCLEPPVPFRRAEHIDKCVEGMVQNDEVDSAITVVNIRGFRPEWMVRIDNAGFIQPYTDYFTRRGEALLKFPASQEFEKLYKTSGVVFSCRTETLVRYQSFVGKKCLAIVIDPSDVFDLDYPEDFDMCEILMQRRN